MVFQQESTHIECFQMYDMYVCIYIYVYILSHELQTTYSLGYNQNP